MILPQQWELGRQQNKWLHLWFTKEKNIKDRTEWNFQEIIYSVSTSFKTSMLQIPYMIWNRIQFINSNQENVIPGWFYNMLCIFSCVNIYFLTKLLHCWVVLCLKKWVHQTLHREDKIYLIATLCFMDNWCTVNWERIL